MSDQKETKENEVVESVNTENTSKEVAENETAENTNTVQDEIAQEIANSEAEAEEETTKPVVNVKTETSTAENSEQQVEELPTKTVVWEKVGVSKEEVVFNGDVIATIEKTTEALVTNAKKTLVKETTIVFGVDGTINTSTSLTECSLRFKDVPNQEKLIVENR